MNLNDYRRNYNLPLRMTTLGILRQGDHVFLGMKKRGFGAGKWNFPGGKGKEGEAPERCVIRETRQEFKTRIGTLHLVAILYFYFADVDPIKGWDQKCYVFAVDSWSGQPQESGEMLPQRWPIAAIPYEQMWPADRHWIEPVLSGEVLTGYFLFTAEPKCLEHQIVPGQIIDE